MKTPEEIQNRIDKIKQSTNPMDRVELIYLSMALRGDAEWELEHLLRKYSFEIEEDQIVVNILKWILDK